jgi:RHS repeat-associated protein
MRYSGKERDATRLYYYGFRYYAPWLQRWINPDPAGEVDGLNRYRFVRNNPLNHSDKWGLNSNLYEEATQAYDHMLGQGSMWRDVWNHSSGETSLQAIKRLSMRNVHKLEAQLETEGQHRLSARIRDASPDNYVLTHFSHTHFVDDYGGVEFLSRQRVVANTTDNIALHNLNTQTTFGDVDKLATDQFIFFSIDTQAGRKPKSRFGSHRYELPLAALGERAMYSHLELTDLLNTGIRQTSRAQTLSWYREEVNPRTGKRKTQDFIDRAGLDELTIEDSIFYGDQMLTGLGMRIAADLPSLTEATQEAVLEWTTDDHPIENLGEVINAFYRPQVVVPGRLPLAKGQFNYQAP